MMPDTEETQAEQPLPVEAAEHACGNIEQGKKEGAEESQQRCPMKDIGSRPYHQRRANHAHEHSYPSFHADSLAENGTRERDDNERGREGHYGGNGQRKIAKTDEQCRERAHQ